MNLCAGERMLEAVVLLEVLVAQRYPRVVDINSQAALAILKRNYIQGGPSASGKKYVDIKFEVPLPAWVTG